MKTINKKTNYIILALVVVILVTTSSFKNYSVNSKKQTSFILQKVSYNKNVRLPAISLLKKVTDIDGNKYNTVKIGSQVWLVENLKVTHYNNGDEIPNVQDTAKWNNLTSGAYCNYDNKISNSDIYGHLYNWYAVNDKRKICPDGWHIPTDAEWQKLIDNLGGEIKAGGKLKLQGTELWTSFNVGATNKSGFTALPGGSRINRGIYSANKNASNWWSATEYGNESAWSRFLYYYDEGAYRSYSSKRNGLSIRCIKDK